MTRTRRQTIVQLMAACGGLALASSTGLAKTESGAMGSMPIHQEEDFMVPPARIYQVLLDAKEFAAFTGGRAEIDPAPGGAFKLFDDRILGRHIELVPNQRVVQAWREPAWPQGVYSIVRFELKPKGTGTRLVFDHWGFPEENRAHLAIGWKSHYWDGMRKYFAIPAS